MKVNRRNFLKTSGVFGVGVMAFNPFINAFGKADKSSKKDPVSSTWVATTCQGCTTWCPIECNVQDGRVVKVRGNGNSMINDGKVCPRGHMIPSQAYDPDRLKVPMKRTNPTKGTGVDPGFIPTTWADALNIVATKIMELRTADETDKYMLLRGRYTYSRDIIYGAMTKIIGSPNGVSHSSICAEAENAAADYTEGTWGYRDYDLNNTNFLLLWGVDPFRSNRGIPSAMASLKTMQANGAKIVTVDPVLTGGAAKSDQWLPIIPGEDGALAVAIAHYLLVSNKWNTTFVGDFNGTGVSGFLYNTPVVESDFTEVESQGLIKWWNAELLDKTPAWAATKCGISETDIITLADEMAAAAPNVCVWYGPGPCMSPRGVYAGMAINALNGLLGGIDNVGGSTKRVSVSSKVNNVKSYTAFEDATALAGLARPKLLTYRQNIIPAMSSGVAKVSPTNNVASAMIADPNAIKVVIAYRANFSFSCADTARWHTALAALPFLAMLTTHANEMCDFADVVLPCSMNGVETYSYLKTAGNLYGEAVLQQPLITPIFDVKEDEKEIPWMLAQELKNNHAFSELADYFDTYTDPDLGVIPSTEGEFAEYATKYFLEPAYSLLTGGWAEMKTIGLHTEGPQTTFKRWGGGFGTPSGKFEFYSDDLKTYITAHATTHYAGDIDADMLACSYEAQGEKVFVPHYESPKRWGTVGAYPFTFIDSKSRYNREGRSANNPLYYQFKSLDPGDENWEDCIKINPADLGICIGGPADGEDVIVESVAGTLVCKLKLWEGIRPGTAAKCYGQGHTRYGRFASADYANAIANGGNNNNILVEDYERLSGATARNGGFVGVKITKL